MTPRWLAWRSLPRNAVHVYRLEAFRSRDGGQVRAASNRLPTPDILKGTDQAPPLLLNAPAPPPSPWPQPDRRRPRPHVYLALGGSKIRGRGAYGPQVSGRGRVGLRRHRPAKGTDKFMSDVGKPLRFSNLQLKNWKNFAFCDVAIGRRAFLVGPNAAGKSNLLDVFRFLRDLASSGGGFQQAVSRRGGVSAIRCLAARRYPDIELNVVVIGVDGSSQ